MALFRMAGARNFQYFLLNGPWFASWVCKLRSCAVGQGWGLLIQFPRLHYFPSFSELSKLLLHFEYHVQIWCSLYMQWHLSNTNVIQQSGWYFCKIGNFRDGEIYKRNFSDPHPRPAELADSTPWDLEHWSEEDDLGSKVTHWPLSLCLEGRGG